MSNIIQKISINIKEFLRNIFKKKKLMLEQPRNVKAEEKDKNVLKELSDIEKLRNEKKDREKMKEIIDITEENPELLDNLSIKQLKAIDNYYDESLEEINRKIAEFRAKLSK